MNSGSVWTQFNSSHKLKKASEFHDVFLNGYRVGNQSFLFLAKPNDIGLPRLGIAIPKKYMKRSVDRNRVKRVIRETFRLNQSSLRGMDIVIVLRSTLIQINQKKFQKIFIKTLMRVNQCVNYS